MSICLLIRPNTPNLLGAGGQNIRVTYNLLVCQRAHSSHSKLTSVKDGHGGATEELTASGTQLNLYRQYVSGSPPKS
jgi:hypothetical protein